MSATIEHKAAVKRQRATHIALAKELGRDDLAAFFARQDMADNVEPDADEVARDMVAVAVRRAIEDAAAVFGAPYAARLASESISDILGRRS
jgi:hypothetical protein